MAQCPEIALAPNMLEVPVYAAYGMFDAQNAVRLHRLADETAAVWHDLDPPVRSRAIVSFTHAMRERGLHARLDGPVRS